MTLFSFYLFDAAGRLITAHASRHDDILDAFERMRVLLAEAQSMAMVQLWQGEEFVAHLKRSDGRLIVHRRSEAPPAHPLSPLLSPAKAS
jgi:hypothetical protein